ncbi:hypothetical protein ATI61_101463 [Archangium gephyra]|uniref:Uncharacterized protein n=1 Tax=Archangium gephyra TaxID=48 RepID=A0AAC8QBL2_9BACT|nr:hypothetical protein [Archangium gephyra]AKJ04449.1 Hypothetical protein AA314_06075 [Archangium gephyra]REG37477.1 hypothetical protein ATI61_101463 [Archangium gephyra]
MHAHDTAFYRRWITANGQAEAAGLGTTFVAGRLAAPYLEQVTGGVAILGGALGAILLGVLLEGVVVGLLQERVLRQRLPSLRRGAWLLATSAGAGLAWLLGMVPSTVMALGANASPGPAPEEPGALVQYGLAMAMGLVTGPILGLAQWTVLRGLVPGSGRWLWANALAWGVGMPVIFMGMDLVPWTGPFVFVALSLYLVCGVTGVVVGAIHGRVLVRLLQPPGPA